MTDQPAPEAETSQPIVYQSSGERTGAIPKNTGYQRTESVVSYAWRRGVNSRSTEREENGKCVRSNGKERIDKRRRDDKW